MAASDPVLRAPRASDADREQVIEVLRAGSVDGRLSHETFVRRMEMALHARRQNELVELLADLRPAGGPARREGMLIRAVGAWSEFTVRVRAAWRAPRVPRLVLPGDDRAVYTIGRSADCDLVIGETTVSAHHAELRRAGDGWLLADVGSTNGTRVNGWRVGDGASVRDGDYVTFGRARLRVSERARR